MDKRRSLRAFAVLSTVVALTGCTSASSGGKAETPGLEARGTVLTTVKPTRQDITNQISLAGKVTIDPVFGIVAPIAGELRYLDRQPAAQPAEIPVWVATVWGKRGPSRVQIPQGAILAGRLLQDHAAVSAGMPIVSAKHSGYGIVADIDSAQAYRISGAVKSVQAQIKNGPGPFRCTALGTIAALPAGSIPEPPPTSAPPASEGKAPPEQAPDAPPAAEGSEPTGLRLVCTAPDKVKLINGAAVTLNVVTARAAHVLVLPVEAVAGAQGKGKVDLVGEDRVRKTVDVVLGLTDGKFIQIRSGLKGTETVAIPGPNLPTAAPGPGSEGQSSGGPG